MKNKLAKLNQANISVKDTPSMIQKMLEAPTTIGILEALTGLASSDNKSLILSGGRLAQAALKHKLLLQLRNEIWELREKGKIKDIDLNSSTGEAAFSEFIEVIEKEPIDQKKFDAIKKLFFECVYSSKEEKERKLNLHFLRIVLKLTALDVEVLSAVYSIYINPSGVNVGGINSAGEWVTVVADRLGYVTDLVDISEPNLVSLGLLHARTFSDKSGVNLFGRFRLTNLGIRISEVILS